MSVELALIEQMREFETPLVAEAMGAMGCKEPEKYYTGSDIKLLTEISEPMVGAALTLVADTSTPGNKGDANDLWKAYEMIKESKLPVVVVVKAIGSRPKHECMLGDGMAKILKASGSSGLITDGGARDIENINKVGYTVFGCGTVANHVGTNYKISKEPIIISGVSFTTADLIHGDRDGIVIVPEIYHKHIVEVCTRARDVETRVHLFWRRTNKTLAEKRKFVTRMFKEHYEKCRQLFENR
ncbi:MAG: RraA family protein [Sedimentisphaerales bacterium]|nr:RraA family protein [Sedimentisphaerales bacterium]